MKRLFIILIFMCLTTLTYAGMYAGWGVAIDRNHKMVDVNELKFLEVGINGKAFYNFVYQTEMGFWVDSRLEKVSSSFYTTYQLGVEPQFEKMYINYFVGPGIVSHTDMLLGSNLQIVQEIGFGFKDVRNVRIGCMIKHLSNGGTSKPNIGRNFIGIKVQF